MTIATVRSAAAARVPLAHALDLGPEAWDQLLTRSGLSNPFLTWAWYRACAVAVPAAEVDSCHAVVLRGATGDLEAVFPFRPMGTGSGASRSPELFGPLVIWGVRI